MVESVMNLLNSAIGASASMFIHIMNETRMVGVFFSAVFIYFLFKFIISPIVGAATWTGVSDSIRSNREQNRYKGSFEKNNRGKYQKKD